MELTVIASTDTPSASPITLTDAKEHLYLTNSGRDVEVCAMLSAATEFCERSIGGHRRFMLTTFDGVQAAFPVERLPLPLPPLSSVTSVKYVDGNGTTQTLSSTAYDVVTPTDEPGYITPAFSETWPTARSQHNAVTIRFVAGYASGDAVPDTVKAAIKLVLGHLFQNRSEVVTGTMVKQLEQGVDSLLAANEYGHYA